MICISILVFLRLKIFHHVFEKINHVTRDFSKDLEDARKRFICEEYENTTRWR